MTRVLLLLAALLGPSVALADSLPSGAILYLPILAEEITARWPDVPSRSAMGSQVEQETCITLRHRSCWNPHAELKTDREYGFGFGQLTITRRFNAWAEVKTFDPSLRNWKWENRYDPRLQLRSMIVKNRFNFARLGGTTPQDRLAFALAGYNGGLGGVVADISLCKATPGCDPGRWFGNVEKTSRKSRVKWKGYGASAFEINREYVRNVLHVRRQKYVAALGE